MGFEFRRSMYAPGSIVTLLALASIFWAGRSRADHTPFDYGVARFEVSGQVSFADEFDDAIVAPWQIIHGSVAEAGGELRLRSPGDHVHVWEWFSGPAFDMSSANAPAPAQVAEGSGDFEAISTWTALPDMAGSLDHGFYSMSFFWVEQTQNASCAAMPRPGGQPVLWARNISVALRDWKTVPAPFAGPTGLAFGENNTATCLGDLTDNSDNRIVQVFGTPPPPIAITPLAGENVVLRLSFDDANDEILAAYSVDSGTNFVSPWPPIELGTDFAGLSGNFRLAGTHLNVVAVPLSTLSGRVAAAVLLVLTAASPLAGRLRRPGA